MSPGIGIAVVVSAGLIGMILGTISGYFGGTVDQVIMRIMDMVLAFPALVLAMALSAALGPNLQNAMIAIAIVKIPVYVRLARGQTLELRQRDRHGIPGTDDRPPPDDESGEATGGGDPKGGIEEGSPPTGGVGIGGSTYPRSAIGSQKIPLRTERRDEATGGSPWRWPLPPPC